LSAAFVAHALLRGGLRPEWLDPEVRTTRVVFRTCHLVHQRRGEERSGSDAVRADRILPRVVALLFAGASFSGPASMRRSCFVSPLAQETDRRPFAPLGLEEPMSKITVPPLTFFRIRRHRLSELQCGRKLSSQTARSETFVTEAAFCSAGESDAVERPRTPSVVSDIRLLRE